MGLLGELWLWFSPGFQLLQQRVLLRFHHRSETTEQSQIMLALTDCKLALLKSESDWICQLWNLGSEPRQRELC